MPTNKSGIGEVEVQVFELAEDKKQELVESLGLEEGAADRFVGLFEASVNKVTKQLAEDLNAQRDELVSEFEQSITEDVDNYLEYVVEQFASENKEVLERAAIAERNNEAVNAVVKALREHRIEVPEGETDLIDDLSEDIKGLKEQVSNLLEERKTLRNGLTEYRSQEILADITQGLSESKAEKLLDILSDIPNSDLESFERKARAIAEGWNSSTESSDDVTATVGGLVTESKDSTSKKGVHENSPISAALHALKVSAER